MSNRYDGLSREQLIELLKKRDRTKKLGLVWERNEIEADEAVDENFVAATPIPELCEKQAPWRNLVIEGDNFDALRWLRMTMAGRVKCIYIDPPYNTGNKDWVYNDHYVDKEDRYRHSTWLEFLYRRLTLARDLLSEDGVMLVSINDEQRAKLELLMDEALPGMRVGSLVWRNRKTTGTGHRAFLSQNHEHILVYSKSKFSFNGAARDNSTYRNPDDDPRGPWDSGPLTLGFSYLERPNLYYPLHDPKTDTYYPCNPNRVWAYASRERLSAGQKLQSRPMEEWVELEQVLFPENGQVRVWRTRAELDEAIRRGEVPKSGQTPLLNHSLPNLDFWVGKKVGFGTPRFKRFLKDVKNPTQPLSSWIVSRSEVRNIDIDDNTVVSGTNDEGTSEVRTIFLDKVFSYPKPVSLIRHLIQQSTGRRDLVLDFFAGSGTTAQAVMELNTEDGGERRFILISSTEATIEDRQQNLCRDVTARRIRLLNASGNPKYAELAAEFAYLRCQEIEFENLDQELTPPQVWAALETIHDLPLTELRDAPWQEHRTEAQTLIFADRVNGELVEHLRRLAERRENVFVYAWAPGQITQALGPAGIEVRSVHETLLGRFRQ